MTKEKNNKKNTLKLTIYLEKTFLKLYACKEGTITAILKK
jgi:hypothetical protein